MCSKHHKSQQTSHAFVFKAANDREITSVSHLFGELKENGTVNF